MVFISPDHKGPRLFQAEITLGLVDKRHDASSPFFAPQKKSAKNPNLQKSQPLPKQLAEASLPQLERKKPLKAAEFQPILLESHPQTKNPPPGDSK